MPIPKQNSHSHAPEAPLYGEIAAATIKLLAEGPAVILPSENPEVFDVSLVAGHAGLFEAPGLDFDDLTSFVGEPLRELCRFGMLDIVPSAQTHLTLFPLFQNKPRSSVRQKHCRFAPDSMTESFKFSTVSVP